VSQLGDRSDVGGADPDILHDQALAVQLINGCNAALRVFRIHQEANAAVDMPIQSLSGALEDLAERHDSVVLAHVDGAFYFGDGRLRLSTTQQQIADQLAKELSDRQLGGLRFDGAPPRDELTSCFRVLSDAGKQPDVSAESIRRDLREADVSRIRVLSVLKPVTDRAQQGAVKQTDRAAEVYKAAIAHAAARSRTVSSVAGRRSGKHQASARAKRIVHELVDMSQRDAGVLLALAGLRGTGADDAEHAIAVAILSIALGNRLGLGKTILADLGVAAVYHDDALGELGGSGSNDELRHPVLGLRAVLGNARPDERLLRQVLVAYEHHRDYAPQKQTSGEEYVSRVHPLSQIVRLANDFDGLTRGRRGVAEMDVPGAIAKMEEGAGRLYHRGLLSVFAEMIIGEPLDDVDDEALESAREDLDLMLSAFLEGRADEAPESPGIATDSSDVGAAAPKPVAPPTKAKKTKKKSGGQALGVLKLKKIAMPHASA
jgi:hypothetical protein